MTINKKAIIHTFEAILASMLLIGYFLFVYSSFDEAVVEKEVKSEGQIKSQIFSFLSAFKHTDTTYFIEQNNQEQLDIIFKYFFGIDRGFSLITDGLPKNQITIGVVAKTQKLVSTNLCPLCDFPSHSDYNAYNENFESKNIAIVNISGNKTNALYIDDDDNNKFNDSLSEGPFLQGTIVNINNGYWSFIINNSFEPPKILFINASDTIKLKEKLNLHIANQSNFFYANNRQISFDIQSVSLNQSYDQLKDNDILFFYNYNKNLKLYKSKLKKLVDDKIALFEITDKHWEQDAVQTEIFNLKRDLTYDVTNPLNKTTGNNTNVSLNANFVDMSVKEFFNDNIITLATKRYYPDLNYTSAEDGELNYSIGNRTAFAAEFFVNKIPYYIAIVKNAGIYSNLYISNQTYNNQTNFTGEPYNKSYSVGNEINITYFNYEILEIDPKARFVKLENKDKIYKFPDEVWEMPYLYVQPRIMDINERYILFKQDRFYNATILSIGDNVTNGSWTSKNAKQRGIFDCSTQINCTSAYFTTFTLEVAVANCSELRPGYDSFFIDLPETQNHLFNNTYEGPFRVFEGGDVLRIDSEYYKIHLNNTTGEFNLTLIKRWQVPVAIINHIEKKGTTVWMVNPQNSTDGWAIVKSTLAAFSNKEEAVILTNPSRRNSLFEEDIFFLKDKMYIPYVVKLGVWYP